MSEISKMAEEYVEKLAQSKLGISLREHQIAGLNGILQWHDEGHGGIIADEMGLGKTCQAIASIVCLLNKNRNGRHMVVCPLSVLDHWQKELTRFGLGELHIVKYIGDAETRKSLKKKMNHSKNWNVLLTTYEMVMRDEKKFRCVWSSLFIDEAHRLKSNKSLLHQVVREMVAEFIVLLTGTPVQNNLNELYSLLSLIDVKEFPLFNEDQFVAQYQNTNDKQVLAKLQQLLSKYIIRRTKEMVHINIPNSSELVIYHGITDIQKNLYRAVLTKNYQYFARLDDKMAQCPSRTSLLNILMQLRKCTLHPYMFNGVEPEPFKEGDHLFKASGKFVLLDRLLTFLFKNSHRILLFSQMTRALDIVQDYLIYKGYNYQRLDGSVRAEERFAAIDCFQDNPDIFCFLLSTRAGGLGLNLTGADTVIFLDSDFNPQNDIQAAARCHRIGQTKPVRIIRLVARYTVEDMIQCRAARKLQMTANILGCVDGKKDLTAAEVSDLILKGLRHLNSEKISPEVLSMKAIEELVGKTDENGHWVFANEEKQAEDSMKPEFKVGVENMYVFEGYDYKQDIAALHDIIHEAKATKHSLFSLDDRVHKRKIRKQFSKEEIEEQLRKRKETLEQKEKLKKEMAERKKKEQEEKKAMKWLQNNYTSSSLPLHQEDQLQDDDSGVYFGPHFVYGSVLNTQKSPNDNSDHALIVHVVDDSGTFGHSGIFFALRKKSQLVVDTYELAGRMDDLHLGDAHIIEGIAEELPITPLKQCKRFRSENECGETEQSTSTVSVAKLSKRKISVVLLVAERYSRRDTIDQNVLAKCFKKLAYYAVTSGARSVHMPRLGYDKQNISWYAIERLIRRVLISKGIHTYIYYLKKIANSVTNSTSYDICTRKRRALTQTDAGRKKQKWENADSDKPEW